MIKKETELKNKISAKGILVGVDDEGLRIEDPKSKSVDTLSMDELKIFIGKEISFSVVDSTKSEEPITGDENTKEEE